MGVLVPAQLLPAFPPHPSQMGASEPHWDVQQRKWLYINFDV
mgnify:CR=1 FL=1